MSELEEGFKPLGRNKKQVIPTTEKKMKNYAVKIDEELVNQVNAYGYWEGFSQSEITEQALHEFFEKRNVQPMPENIRKKMEQAAKSRKKGRMKKA